ncbi:hypothetical protein MNBD_ALPHA06-2309, partial [hydrothermal vent metagenome]
MNWLDLIKSRFILVTALLVFGLFACAQEQQTTPMAWKLDTANSQLSLFVVKADAVGETFTLKLTKGSVSDQGTANVEIDLTSIETGISIRNERMREHLFE